MPRLRAQLHGASGVQHQMLLALQEVLHATEDVSHPLVLCSLLWGQRLAKYLKFQVQRISAYGHLVEFEKTQQYLTIGKDGRLGGWRLGLASRKTIAHDKLSCEEFVYNTLYSLIRFQMVISYKL